MNKTCLITGVGPGTGSALVRRFASGGYQVAMLARSTERLEALAGELDNVRPFTCDVSTGNTSAYRGKPAFAGFAPSKAAQRILLESIARESGPKGIHAAYLAIDAVVDLPWTRRFFKDKPDEFFCQPADIAAACYDLAHQPRSAWASEMVIRPFGENW